MTSHILQIEALIVCVLGMWILGRFPYFNIYLTLGVVISLLSVFTLAIFRVSKEWLLVETLLLFASAAAETIAGNSPVAEELGNAIYFLLWIVCIMYGVDLWRTKK